MKKIELLKFKSELIYKKIVVLLAVAGGSGAYSVRFYEHGNVGVALFLIVAFLFFALGIGVNFLANK